MQYLYDDRFEDVSFDSRLSHITPDSSAHFLPPIVVLWLTSVSEPSTLGKSDPTEVHATEFTAVLTSPRGLALHSVVDMFCVRSV